MKSFRKLISEVAQPKGDDELSFKEKHMIDTIDHPESEEGQHVAPDHTHRAGKRIADYDEYEDEDVYESSYPDNLPGRRASVADINKTSKYKVATNPIGNKKKQIITVDATSKNDAMNQAIAIFKGKGLKSRVDFDGLVISEALDPVDKKSLSKKFSDRSDKDIDNDGDVDNSDEYLHNRRKTISAAIKKESTSNFDWIKDSRAVKSSNDPKFISSMIKKWGERGGAWLDHPALKEDASHFITKAAAAKNKGKKTFDLGNKKYPVTIKDKAAKAVHEETEILDEKTTDLATDYKTYKDYTKTRDSEGLQVIPEKLWNALKKNGTIKEAFKVGSLKLKDGSSVALKKQDAELLNQMFNDLNAANKKKMEKVLMTDASGFEEILGFAKEAL